MRAAWTGKQPHDGARWSDGGSVMRPLLVRAPIPERLFARRGARLRAVLWLPGARLGDPAKLG